ncbi:MAG TPA: FAD:protein FMN transferase, partial [Candidatus Bathyarchaeia archaeon]|nr:FAD:protein FMN transferase [Candidatus Bathyarchaeia archaeon]
GRPWRIGIQHPRKDGRLIDIVELSNQGVVTSGDYEKFYEINGRKWSHIVNPLTGYPQQGVVSATVIAPTAIEADVFSTTLCIWPPAKGIDFVEQLGESYAAFLIEDDPGSGLKFYPSQGYLPKSSGIYHKDAK